MNVSFPLLRFARRRHPNETNVTSDPIPSAKNQICEPYLESFPKFPLRCRLPAVLEPLTRLRGQCSQSMMVGKPSWEGLLKNQVILIAPNYDKYHRAGPFAALGSSSSTLGRNHQPTRPSRRLRRLVVEGANTRSVFVAQGRSATRQ